MVTNKRILDEFTLGYIYSALCELNSEYNISDIYPFYLNKIIDDCIDFQQENKELLDKVYSISNTETNKVLPEHLGHDFWLCRNGFESEFIARVPKELAQYFEQASRKRGKQEFVVDGDTLKFRFSDAA